MKTKSAEEIRDFLTPIAEGLKIRIVDVELKKGKNPELTIFIDKDGGMDLDTCEAFHNAINTPLDEFDPTFDTPYTLNVSSPGLDRPFKTDEDFNSHIEKRVEVKLYNSIKGKKFLDGILKKYDGQAIVINVDKSTTLSIDMKNIVKVNEYIDFE